MPDSRVEETGAWRCAGKTLAIQKTASTKAGVRPEPHTYDPSTGGAEVSGV